jgi:hypothetical protein
MVGIDDLNQLIVTVVYRTYLHLELITANTMVFELRMDYFQSYNHTLFYLENSLSYVDMPYGLPPVIQDNGVYSLVSKN